MGTMTRASLIVAVIVLLAGCGSDGGDLANVINQGNATFKVLDLTSGAVSYKQSISDLTTNPAYGDTLMVFRRVATGGDTLGSPVSEFGHQASEPQFAASIDQFYIGVFEVTTAQWQRLAGTTPWTSVTPESVIGWSAFTGATPACNLSADDVTAACASFSSGYPWNLTLPTSPQWEFAARAGTDTEFSWGSSTAVGTVGNYAVIRETNIDALSNRRLVGPQEVGSHSPNPIGLFDVHGNVWELTSDGDARGGSWSDPVAMARSASAIAVPSSSPQAKVGVRLVLVE